MIKVGDLVEICPSLPLDSKYKIFDRSWQLAACDLKGAVGEVKAGEKVLLHRGYRLDLINFPVTNTFLVNFKENYWIPEEWVKLKSQVNGFLVGDYCSACGGSSIKHRILCPTTRKK